MLLNVCADFRLFDIRFPIRLGNELYAPNRATEAQALGANLKVDSLWNPGLAPGFFLLGWLKEGDLRNSISANSRLCDIQLTLRYH